MLLNTAGQSRGVFKTPRHKQTNNVAPQKFKTVYIFCTYIEIQFFLQFHVGVKLGFSHVGKEHRLRVLLGGQGAEGDIWGWEWGGE